MSFLFHFNSSSQDVYFGKSGSHAIKRFTLNNRYVLSVLLHWTFAFCCAFGLGLSEEGCVCLVLYLFKISYIEE